MYNRKSLYSLSSAESLAKFSQPRKLPPVKSQTTRQSRTPPVPPLDSGYNDDSVEKKSQSRDRNHSTYGARSADSKSRSKYASSPSVDDSSAFGKEEVVCGSPFFGAIETLFGHTKTNASKREETDAKSGRRQRNMKAASFLRSEDEEQSIAPSPKLMSGQNEPLPRRNRGRDRTDDEISSVTSAEAYLEISSRESKPRSVDNNFRTAQKSTEDSSITPSKSGLRLKSSAQIQNQSGITRIVAPNVDKLSYSSVVEVKIQGSDEIVSVLCASDVLKMRSVYFYEMLSTRVEHEPKPTTRGIAIANTPQASDDTSVFNASNSNGREEIVIYDSSPFECAAFLESLHDGRNLSTSGEWSYNWARLSVSWKVEDVMSEFAGIVDAFVGHLLDRISRNNWRTNSDVISGFRVATIRKGGGPAPTIVTGVALEGNQNTPYGSVRVAFDLPEKSAPPKTDNDRQGQEIVSDELFSSMSSTDCNQTGYAIADRFPHLDLLNNLDSRLGSAFDTTPLSYQIPNGGNMLHQPAWQSPIGTEDGIESVVCDVGVPLWVLGDYEGAIWCDPDELFVQDAKKILNATDKVIFWEMMRALTELPEFANRCRGRIRNAIDLTHVLRRTEYNVLWSSDVPDFLPKKAALALIAHKYCHQE